MRAGRLLSGLRQGWNTCLVLIAVFCSTAWLVSGPRGCASNNHLPLGTVMSWKQALSSLGLHQSCVWGALGSHQPAGHSWESHTAMEEQCHFSHLFSCKLGTLETNNLQGFTCSASRVLLPAVTLLLTAVIPSNSLTGLPVVTAKHSTVSF